MKIVDLEAMAPHILLEFGVVPAWPGSTVVKRLADKDACTIAISLPHIIENVEVGERAIHHGGETLVDLLVAGRDRLFAKVHDHIAEHENTRVRQLENALDEAIKLIYSRILSYGPDEYEAVARLQTIRRGAP